MKKILTLILISLAFCLNLNAQVFNDKLTAEEQQRLANGELLIRNIGKVKNVCINKQNDILKQILDVMTELKPAYTAEIIQIIPYSGNEDALDKLSEMLINVQGYVGIPYYSEKAEAYYDLYSSANVKSFVDDGKITKMRVDLEMEPFGVIDTDIFLEKTDDSIYYVNQNLNLLKYHDKFTVVRGKNMKTIISVFREGDSWILYGIGGVKAPSIFFLRDRVETSFMNRIKTMCGYFFEQL